MTQEEKLDRLRQDLLRELDKVENPTVRKPATPLPWEVQYVPAHTEREAIERAKPLFMQTS